MNKLEIIRISIAVLITGALSLAVLAQSAADSSLLSAIAAGHFAEAVKIADASLQSRPQDPWLWTMRGMALDGAGDSTTSMKSLDKALMLNPKYLPALKAASQFSYLHHNPRAMEYLNRLLAIRPDEPAPNAMAAVLEFEAHRCGRAIPHFEKGAQLILNDEKSATEYAACLFDQRRPADSASILQQALTQHPASRNLRYDLAVSQIESGSSADALATLQSSGDLDSSMLNLRASIEATLGNPAAAFADLKRAAEASPLDERNYLDMALLCLDHNQEQRAVDSLTRGISQLPKAATLYAIRGIAYAQLSKYDEAETDFAQANVLDPKSSFGQAAQTVLYMESEKPEAAKQSLLKQLEKNPNDPEANMLLADLLIHQGASPSTPEFAEAKAAVIRTLDKKPDSIDALNLMGKIESDEDQLAEALPYFEKANKLDSENHATLNQLLLIYRKLGRKEDAARVADQLKSLFVKEAHQSQGDFRTGPAH
ncbi:MAG: tetratricopeptide repeat protein [Terracidiphilus sp.]